MQTFLPFSDFAETAAVLDVRRLGKQRVEVLQILRALTFEDYGWRNHPAVTMWVGHTPALVTYGAAVTDQWRATGFGDTVMPQLLEFLGSEPLPSQEDLRQARRLPAWVGWEPLHRSHQAALLRKDPDHYAPLFPGVDAELPYVWPDSSPPEPDTAPVSGWVLRASADDVEVMRAHAFVGLRPVAGEEPGVPFGSGTRNTKRRRQIIAFVQELAPGDRVLVPQGDMLLVAEVADDYQWLPDAPEGLHHTRHVRWLGELHRGDLTRPVHLQDPRIFFPLRNEPKVRRVG